MKTQLKINPEIPTEIQSLNGEFYADCFMNNEEDWKGTTEARASYIVHCVNNHEALVDCLHLAIRELREFYNPRQSVALTTMKELLYTLENKQYN